MSSSKINGVANTPGPELAILAHELREPLGSILMAADIAKDSGHDELARRQMCEMIERQARHAAQIIDDVLDAARASHGKLVLHKELVDAGAVIAEAVEITNSLFQRRCHHLKVSLPAGKIMLLADGFRLKQILINLLTNAAKYTEPGGMIILSAETRGNSLFLAVRDNGIGIARGLLPRVFDMFHQGDGPMHRESNGLGVGLALVKSLVDLHGGKITAHSHGERTGSTFVVQLPGLASGRVKNREFPYQRAAGAGLSGEGSQSGAHIAA